MLMSLMGQYPPTMSTNQAAGLTPPCNSAAACPAWDDVSGVTSIRGLTEHVCIPGRHKVRQFIVSGSSSKSIRFRTW